MAESTLSVQFSELQREVARFAGWDRTPGNWTSDQTTDFGDILKTGLRRFYYPPSLEPGLPRHQWSFLRPTTTLSLSNTDFDYDLPDDFSGVVLDDSVAFQDGDDKRRLLKISEPQLRALQSQNQASGTPFYFAIRPKAHAPTTGLRYEMLVYPTPDGSMTLTYAYVVAPGTLDASNKYPYGGAIHSQTILEAVLAAAESILDDDPNGVHNQRFLEELGASIRADQEHKSVSEGQNT